MGTTLPRLRCEGRRVGERHVTSERLPASPRVLPGDRGGSAGRETPHEDTGSTAFCLRGIPLLTFFPHPTRVSRGCGSVGRASPCQGEGRASLTRKRSLVRSQYRPPEPMVELSPEPSAPGSCRCPGRSPRAGWHVSPSGRDVVSEVRTIARNSNGLRVWGGGGRGRYRVRIVMFLEWPGTGRPGVLYHLGRSWPLRQETDGYDATLQAPAARGPRR